VKLPDRQAALELGELEKEMKREFKNRLKPHWTEWITPTWGTQSYKERMLPFAQKIAMEDERQFSDRAMGVVHYYTDLLKVVHGVEYFGIIATVTCFKLFH